MTDVLVTPAIFLEWDSDFFKQRIARVVSHCLSDTDVSRVDNWATENRIDCMYYLAEGSVANSGRAAEKRDFHLVDLRVTYQINSFEFGNNLNSTSAVRLAQHADLPTIQGMAGQFHTISRFFADSRFDPILAGKLYEKWIERDFSQPDHYLWVSEQQNKITGYTSASINDDGTAEIGLVGVAAETRGQGVGKQLQKAVLSELHSKGVRHVEVVTQGRNIGAQNLYASCGYQLKSIDLWYHKWYSN